MSREWVKLHTSMLGHVGTMRLSDKAFRVWIVLLMMAGQSDDDGRAGSLDDIVWYFRPMKEADILAAIAEMKGRVIVEGGIVHVRDWSEWQPKVDGTNAERQARWRSRHAETARNGEVRNGNVTPLRNAGSNDATRGRDPEETEDTEKETLPSGSERAGKPRRAALGPGCTALKAVTGRTPPAILRSDVEAVFQEHGEAKMRAVAKEWMGRGFKAGNVAGILSVIAHGWTQNGAPNARHNPAVVATTDRTDRPITAEERQAVIDRQYTRFPNLAPPDWVPPDKRAAASGGAA